MPPDNRCSPPAPRIHPPDLVQIINQSVATIEYTLTDDAGVTIDSSKERGPLVYLHGTGGLLPALEAELEGKVAGDEVKARLEPAQGYGERSDEAVMSIPRTELPAELEIEVGMQFKTESANGPQVVTVAGIEGDQVKLDGNHPLAGVALNFDVKVLEIRPATDEEVTHGHVHGAGGHHH
jgi:FKBP-type peptidyl-prolyl cis-trans isomerase SlyD